MAARWLLLSSVLTVVLGLLAEWWPKTGPNADNALGILFVVGAIWLLVLLLALACTVFVLPSTPISWRNKSDLLLTAGGSLSAVLIGFAALPPLFKSLQESMFGTKTERYVASEQRRQAIEIQQDWAKGQWRGSLPRCVVIEDKGLNNQCAGSLQLTYCWKMDAEKDWGLRSTDCALGEQASIVVAKGFYAMPVPWCRAYSVCVGELHVIDAVAS